MADKPIEQYDDIEFSKKVNNESGMQKLFRAGVLALGFSVVGKKMGVKNNDLLKYTGVAAASMLMSDDDDRVGDLMAVGTVFGVASGSKMLREMAKTDMKTYTKIYDTLESLDKNINKFNIGMLGLKDKVAKSFSYNYAKVVQKQDEEVISKIKTASNYISAGFNTLKEGTSYLFTHKISDTLDALSNNDLKKKYDLYYKNVDLKKIETSVNDYLKDIGIDTKHSDVGALGKFGDQIVSMLLPKELQANNTLSAKDAIKEFQQMKKISLIENNTFFTDMIGMYSKLDKETGKVVARYGQLLKDDANYLKPLGRIADNFISSMDTKTSQKYARLGTEEREKMFLDYLKNSGFQEVIDNFYNKDNHIKIGEVNSLFENLYMDEVQNPEIRDFLSSSTRNQMKNFNTYIKPDDVKGEAEVIEGIKNADILKNFSFTSVVTKTKFGVQDVTALDGSTMFLQALGAFDRNTVSNFKSIFSQQARLWNPFSLIDSKNRIKDVIANDVLGFDYNKYGFLLNGKRITEEAEVIQDGKRELINIKYATNGKTNHRISYKNTVLNVVNEDYKVANDNLRNDSTLKDIIHTYKQKGAKQALSEFSYSAYNPFFGVRYDVGNGFRRANYRDGYFEDKNILSIFGKKNPDDKWILNRKDGKTKSVLSAFFGSHSDVNIDRMRAESDAYEKTINNFKSVLVNQYIDYGIKQGDNRVFNDAVDFISKEYRQNLINSLGNDDPRIMALFNDLLYSVKMPDWENFKKHLPKEYLNPEDTGRLIGIGQEIVDANRTLTYMIAGKMNEKAVNEILSSKSFKAYLQSDKLGLYDPKYFDNMLEAIDNSANKKSMKEMYDVVVGFNRAKRNVDRDIEEFFSYSTEIFRDSFKNASNNLDIHTNQNPFNPVYELIKGKRFNDHFEEFIKTKINDPSSVIGVALNSSIGKADPSYATTNIGKAFEELTNQVLGTELKKGLKKITSSVGSLFGFSEAKDGEDILSIKTYDFFNKVKDDIKRGLENANEDTLIKINDKFGKPNINAISFKNMIKIRDELLYTNPGEVVSSVILEDSFKKGSSVREILREVRNSVLRMISQEPFDVDRKDYNTYLEALKNYKSKNFRRADSTMNIGTKSIINNVQNAMEYIGIERLTNKELGDHFSQQMVNFATKRLMPIFGAAAGLMAADSASDAIVPDEVPILGNGISGVAATGYATARIGAQYALKYSGALSVMRMAENAMPGLISGAPILGMLDPLMDPEEMIDVYFKGKAIRVNDNRWWFTSGRQSAQGEEFGQYRPHFLYQMQHKSSGVYDNKIEKFFRKDFLPSKYLWYMADPYKEERDAYEKFGALHPKTEQLFLDIPVIGGFLNATIGEVIKPTQYIGEEQWKVGDNMMLNPNYNPDDHSSPKYMRFEEPNKFVSSVFEAIDDLETWSGLPGYLAKTVTRGLFGSSNPYENEVTLKSIDDDTNYSNKYEDMELGGLYGITEPVRRLLNGESLNTIDVNPLRQNLPDWMPEFYKRGNNPYMSMAGGEYLMPGELFEDANGNIRDEDLLKLRTLSMLAPYSHEFDETKAKLMNAELSREEKEHLYTSIGYANEYGKSQFIKNRPIGGKDLKEVQLTIDEKISYNEFISDGVRYKLDTVTDDFNKLSQKYGANAATRMIEKVNEQFKEGETYSFQISKNATISGGIDRDGDYFKITSKDIDKRLDLDRSAYGTATFSEMLGKLNIYHSLTSGNAMTMDYEKRYGIKTATNEWSTEHVQAPAFRDWDNPISSFVLPFYTFSANSRTSAIAFGMQASDMYYGSNATTDVLGGLVKLGVARNLVKTFTGGDAITSNEYDTETELQDELEKIKFLSGDKSYYNMTGQENLKQFEGMVNEEDSKFLEELANTQNVSERKEILSHANDRLANVLKTIWNRQQAHLNGETPYQVEQATFNEVVDIGNYDGNETKARLMLQKSMNIGRSKLDEKRYGIIQSYRGSTAMNEASYIQSRMYQRYGTKASIDSTIYPDGIINVNRRRE